MKVSLTNLGRYFFQFYGMIINWIYFSETFIETHKNVSILYADICNFTPLTEKFTTTKIINGKEIKVDRIEDLVATLNGLFTKFDDAAEVLTEIGCNKDDWLWPISETQLYEDKNSWRLLLLHLWTTNPRSWRQGEACQQSWSCKEQCPDGTGDDWLDQRSQRTI